MNGTTSYNSEGVPKVWVKPTKDSTLLPVDGATSLIEQGYDPKTRAALLSGDVKTAGKVLVNMGVSLTGGEAVSKVSTLAKAIKPMKSATGFVIRKVGEESGNLAYNHLVAPHISL